MTFRGIPIAIKTKFERLKSLKDKEKGPVMGEIKTAKRTECAIRTRGPKMETMGQKKLVQRWR